MTQTQPSASAQDVYEYETLYDALQVRFKNTRTLFHEKNDFQELKLFENPLMGRILMLDGVTQVTQGDEFVYHEMMTHVPILAHDQPEYVLIIGGGDGGIAREVVRHQNISRVTMIEIDAAVVEFSKQYLPQISDGVFEHPKLNLKIADGAQFVKETTEKFDIIIVDSTDPQGPGEVLFTKEFYQDCAQCLRDDGILVTQNGVPFMQADELRQSVGFFRDIFNYGTCYRATIPTYAFGEMAMGWASNKDYGKTNLNVIQERFQAQNFKTKYYTPEVHKAAFALPAYFQEILKTS